jgi:hypothetical protein
MPVKKSRGSGRAPRKMSVWDPVQKQAYPIGSEDAMLAGFSRCTQKRVPSYESGACLEPKGARAQELGIYLDTKGKRAPDSYVWVNDEIGWVAECSERADQLGFQCCAGANRFPSPQSGSCIQVGGPTYEELGMMKRRINGADYFSSRDNFAMAPAPSMADGPFWPANTYVVSDADAANFGSERRLRISNANMQRAMNQQSQAPRVSRKFVRPTGPKPAPAVMRNLKPGWVPTGPVTPYENDPYNPRNLRDEDAAMSMPPIDYAAAQAAAKAQADALVRSITLDEYRNMGNPVSLMNPNDREIDRVRGDALFKRLAAEEEAAKRLAAQERAAIEQANMAF